MSFIDARNQKLISCLGQLICSDAETVSPVYWIKTEERESQAPDSEKREWALLDERLSWGGDSEYYWFRFETVIPGELEGETVVLEITTGREGEWDANNPQFLAFVDGETRQGLDVNHREILLTESAVPGQKFRVELSAFTGPENENLIMRVQRKVLHREIEAYYYDVWVPCQVLELLDPETEEAMLIQEALTNSLNCVDFREVYSEQFYASLREAQQSIRCGFYETQCGHSRQSVYAVGHTHIDIAWLWPLAVTEEKAVRSFATVLELMRRYPEYRFMSSQPQLYLFVKKHAPELYEQIRQKVKEGVWEPEGGMFVEADCNVTSGESLVRQFLFGTRFFEKEFGRKNEILWLPDVFGYSAALPQIMKKCGIRYFMTTKISWNETNRMPYDTFLWRGIDGTEILTHFITARDFAGQSAVEGNRKKRTDFFTTYNGMMNPSQIMGGWKRYSQKSLNKSILMCYGYGDGGGGTTQEMLENQRRLSRGIPGCPATRTSTAAEFFHELERETAGKKELPRWVGELYLEYHRGTYTSMARNKKYNRRAEFLLQNIEFFCTLAKLWLGADYPRAEINELWQTVLKNQFHDILPGSAIQAVYEDSRREYEAVFERGQKLLTAALELLERKIGRDPGSLIVWNPNSFAGSDYVYTELPGISCPVVTDGEKECPLQRTADGRWAVRVDQVPPRGYKVLSVREAERSSVSKRASAASVGTNSIETNSLRVIWDERGQLTSIYDKVHGREVVPHGMGANQLVTYEDRPHNYDAWDINDYYTEKAWELGAADRIEVVENGPVRTVLRISRRYLSSAIEQDLIFYPDALRIDIANRIDWREKNVLLRCYIPVDIHAERASYEIQYGNIERPTHVNTSWDQAKFEVCAHKWIDLSEHGYGVSVLNDCKYGCDIHDGRIGLTMLKSATYPNPEADKEYHECSYSIRLHEGGWREAGTVRQAYLFNNPLFGRIRPDVGGEGPQEDSLIRLDKENVIAEVVKLAEDDDSVVVRLYEMFNSRTQVRLTCARRIAAAWECDMLEHKERALQAEENSVLLELRPYEILTVKLSL